MQSPNSFFSQLSSISKEPRLLLILCMGVLSGFPWVIIGTWLSLTLRELEITLTVIGLAGVPALFYTFNILAAPLVDTTAIPGVKKLMNKNHSIHNRLDSWIFSSACLVLLAGLLAAFFMPTQISIVQSLGAEAFLWSAACIVVVAASGAVADVAIDAKRINVFRGQDANKIGLGSTCATIGWWLGYGIGGSILLFSADLLDSFGDTTLPSALLLTMSFYALALLGFLALKDKALENETPVPNQPAMKKSWLEILQMLIATYLAPFKEFLLRNGIKIAILLLVFIFLFKVGEAFLGRMSLIFYSEVGFSKSQIALGSKLTGTLTICVAAIFGGMINLRYGVFTSLIIGGLLMASTNLLFAILAWLGPNMPFFIFSVVADQVTSGISTVAFVAFISSLCHGKFAATQYATFASIANAARTSLALGSGYVVETLLSNRWDLFFILTSVLVIPSFLLLIWKKDSFISMQMLNKDAS